MLHGGRYHWRRESFSAEEMFLLLAEGATGRARITVVEHESALINDALNALCCHIKDLDLHLRVSVGARKQHLNGQILSFGACS